MYAFSHIPKTAGSTFNFLLQKNFGSDLNAIIPRNGSDYLYRDMKLDMNLYSRAKCFSGHGLKPYINYREFNDDLEWLTFLRDPIERFISQYIHQQTSNNSNHHLLIEKWAEKFDRNNWQVKWIAGDNDLAAAKEILKEKFIFVGITEFFDESLGQLKNTFKHSFDIHYDKPKMVVRDDSLKIELLKTKFNELASFYKFHNDLDIQLYEYVLKDFKTKIESKTKHVHESIPDANRFKRNIVKFKMKRSLVYKPYVRLTK